jgi:hypothetical protein
MTEENVLTHALTRKISYANTNTEANRMIIFYN